MEKILVVDETNEIIKRMINAVNEADMAYVEEEETNTFIVDIPNSNDIDDTWIEVETFSSREEAIKFVKKQFGADDEGRINLISEVTNY
jgi:hypothetical protein